MTALSRAHAIVAASAAAEAVYRSLSEGHTLTTWWRALTHSKLSLDDLARWIEDNPEASIGDAYLVASAGHDAPPILLAGHPLEAALTVFQATLPLLRALGPGEVAPAPIRSHRSSPHGAQATPGAEDEPAPAAPPAETNVSPRRAAPARTCATEVASRLRREQAATKNNDNQD